MKTTAFLAVQNLEVLKPEFKGILPLQDDETLYNILSESMNYLEYAEFCETERKEAVNHIKEVFERDGYEVGELFTYNGYNLIPVRISARTAVANLIKKNEKKAEILAEKLKELYSLKDKENITGNDLSQSPLGYFNRNSEPLREKNMLIISPVSPEDIGSVYEIFDHAVSSIHDNIVAPVYDTDDVLRKTNPHCSETTLYILADVDSVVSC